MVVAVVVVLALATDADPLAAMKSAYANVDYEKCKSEAHKALKQPGDKGARVDAYKHLGLCAAALGDTDGAREAFKLMLTLDRDAKLPDGLSPRFTSSFREAKGALVGATPLALAAEKDDVDGGTRTLLVKVTDDAGLVKSLAWRGEGGVLSPPVRAAPKLEMEVPANVDVTIVALDEAQGEIATLPLGRPDAPAPAARAAPSEADEDGGGSLAPVLIGAAVVGGVVLVAGVGAVVAVALLSPPSAVTLKTDVAFQNDKK